MSMATREAFGLALKEVVEKDEKIIVLDADLSGATRTLYVKNARPNQFFSAGIAESNMVTMGAGLAAQGLKPFVVSFAMFLAGRAFEQIRNSVAYPHLNVKLCATHAGITVGEDGATHQCNEDIALMRVLPGMVVLQPCDEVETRAMIKFMKDYEGPVYLRTSRYTTDKVYNNGYQFKLGDIIEIINGKKVALLASGLMVQESKKAIETLNKEGIYPSLFNIATIKPVNVGQLKKIAESHDILITLEEHNVIGGLNSMVSEIVHNKPIYAIGIRDTFTESGTPAELMQKYGLNANSIINLIKSVY